MNDKPPLWTLSALVDDLPSKQQALLRSALQLLHEHELPAVVGVLTGRIFAPITDDGAAGDAREARLVDAEGALQPFTELLLLELASIAVRPGWSAKMRTDKALEALWFCGF
jgi:hypothetical protein